MNAPRHLSRVTTLRDSSHCPPSEFFLTLDTKQFTGVFMKPLDYVLENLYRSRDEAIAHPECFEPNALEQIDKAILYCEDVKRGAKAA